MPEPTFKTIVLSHEGGVSTITLNNPPLNIITPTMLAELPVALDHLARRMETRAIVLTGSGTRAFCAGADVGDEASHGPEAGYRFRQAGRRLVEAIESHPKAIIAGVRGWCIGGGTGLAFPCDIRIASETAKFRAGDVYLGIIPTWSVGMVRLVHYMGRNRALDLLLLGEDVSAKTALEIGLVSKVVPDAEFEAEVKRVAERLASGAPLAITAIKEGIRAQQWEGLDRAARLEEQKSELVLGSQDAKEGMAAFKEKRKPKFKGR